MIFVFPSACSLRIVLLLGQEAVERGEVPISLFKPERGRLPSGTQIHARLSKLHPVPGRSRITLIEFAYYAY